MKQDQLFFVGQKAFVAKGDKVLAAFDSRGKIDFPGGKIQEGEEDFVVSLAREIKEETNLSVAIGAPFTTWSFRLPAGHAIEGKKVFLVGFKCLYRDGEIGLSDEHLRYEWAGRDDLGRLDDGSAHFQALKEYFANP